ncbi:MAG: hypothetical protein Q9P44_10675, partial [Anaerolineae bacterium]|nr:hypothetical protein [Anaerolineae bacterium]
AKYGGIGDAGNPFGMNSASGGNFGGGSIATDYVDLSKVQAPEMPTHKPNKYATSSKSSLKKQGKYKDVGKGVSFGDVTTFHVEKESQMTETDKKSKSDESDSEEDEDEIENKALKSKLGGKKSNQPGTIADMLSKMNTNIDESITESGSLGLKKSVESDDYKISSSHDTFSKKKLKKQKSPTGLTDSDDGLHHKSQDFDSNKKLSSEYDSAELSRNFNYEESEDTLKSKLKYEKNKKSIENDTEYDDDFEASSNLYESSSLSKVKISHETHDEIEDIRKRSEEYKGKLETYKKGFMSSQEHENEVTKRLDSYRAQNEIREESDSSASFNVSPTGGLKGSKMTREETQLSKLLKRSAQIRDGGVSSGTGQNSVLTREKYAAEIQAKEYEMDAEISKREAQNTTETNKLLKDRILGYVQDINMYRVEIEGLKRQVDFGDSNLQSKEEELNQVKHEHESQLKLERERNVNTNVRMDNREINDLKKSVRLTKAAHEQDSQEKFEEIDYLTKRCDKLESENVALRVGSKAIRDAENKAKKFEDEMHSLKMRLKEERKSKEAKPLLGVSYNSWTKEQLVKELLSIDNAIERFTKENEGLMFENKKQLTEIGELNHLLRSESKKLEEYKHKMIKETGSVLIVGEEKDLHTQLMNDLGVEHAITQKEFISMKERLFKIEHENGEMQQEF